MIFFFLMFLGDSRSCAASSIHLQETMLICLVLLTWMLSRRTSSESEVT